MHKFVPWSRIGIFRNERTRSTPFNPKLMYWCVSWCLGALWIVSLLHEARCKTRWTGAINWQDCAMKSHQKFCATNTPDQPHWTLNYGFGASRSVWVYLAIFCYYTKVGARRVELVQLMNKFVPWNCIWFFRNERTRSTTLDHKLMFWCVS